TTIVRTWDGNTRVDRSEVAMIVGVEPSSTRASDGVRPLASTTMRIGFLPGVTPRSSQWTRNDGSSLTTVPTPTRTASAFARKCCTRSRSSGEERAARFPPANARRPSSEAAQFTQTVGRRGGASLEPTIWPTSASGPQSCDLGFQVFDRLAGRLQVLKVDRDVRESPFGRGPEQSERRDEVARQRGPGPGSDIVEFSGQFDRFPSGLERNLGRPANGVEIGFLRARVVRTVLARLLRLTDRVVRARILVGELEEAMSALGQDGTDGHEVVRGLGGVDRVGEDHLSQTRGQGRHHSRRAPPAGGGGSSGEPGRERGDRFVAGAGALDRTDLAFQNRGAVEGVQLQVVLRGVEQGVFRYEPYDLRLFDANP